MPSPGFPTRLTRPQPFGTVAGGPPTSTLARNFARVAHGSVPKGVYWKPIR